MVIRLFCNAGMSTSILVRKMQEAARQKGKDADIRAYSFSEISDNLDGVDVVLLGPQIAFEKDKAKELCKPRGIPCEVINTADYGLANGMAVLKTAYKLAQSKDEIRRG